MSQTNSKKTSQTGSSGSIFDTIALCVRFLSGLILVLLVALISAEIISRFFFNYSLKIVDEIAGYLVVALTLFGASLALRDKRLFQVSFLLNKLPSAAQRYLNYVYLIISLGVCSILIWNTLRLVLSSFSWGNFAPTNLMTPLWIPQLVLPIGSCFIAIFLIEHAILALRTGGHD